MRWESVADKRNIRKNLKRIQAIKTWQLVVLLLLSLFVSATLLRMNNTSMIQRRDAIEGADKSGDTQETASRIYDLQRFSAAHMNADTGVFYLQAQYDRDVKKAVGEASGGGAEGSPQARADAKCNPNLQIHGYSLAYQNCMLEELSKEGQVVDPSTITLPNPSLYRYAFTSPIWSPDFAGWSVLFSLLIAVMIVSRFIVWAVLKLLLRHHYRRV